jgi:hypothetical protein
MCCNRATRLLSRRSTWTLNMKLSRTIRVAVLIFGAGLCAAAQNDVTTQETPSQPAQPETTPAPAPAFGQNAPVLNPENPPISGLDQPTLEMRGATRSFISPGLQVSESADTNTGNQLGNSQLKSATRVLGALDLQKFWPKSDFFLEYLGGGVFFSHGSDNVRQLHALAGMFVTRWRTGQITFRDSFSDLPEGSFSVGAYGGAPGLGLARGGVGVGIPGGGLPGLTGHETFGGIGLTPRISNLAIADIVQSISPRSALTVAGGYTTAHFLENNPSLINSQQFTIEGGYSHLINRRDQAAIVYGFQEFVFPLAAGGKIDVNVVNLRYSRTITGRLNLLVGAGPQFVSIYNPEPGGSVTQSRVSLSARARLIYKFPKTSLAASYEKYTSSGSGFFAGADTQVARMSMNRPLGRTWEFFGDFGYSYHKRLQDFGLLGVPASTYSDGFVGVAVRKQIGRNYGIFAASRFSDLAFNTQVCLSSNCGRVSQRYIGTVGVDWHPRPIRIE